MPHYTGFDDSLAGGPTKKVLLLMYLGRLFSKILLKSERVRSSSRMVGPLSNIEGDRKISHWIVFTLNDVLEISFVDSKDEI